MVVSNGCDATRPEAEQAPKLDDQACAQAVCEVIADVGAEKLKDTGRVMTELKSRYPGQMDFAKARRMICQRLG